MTRVLITGGSGFIGTATHTALRARGHDVSTYDASDGLDIRDPDSLLNVCVQRDVETVVHLAGVLGTHELFDTPGLAVDVNVNGSLNVLEACRETGAAYVGIAMPDVFPSIYTATKIAAMRLAEAYRHTHGVKVAHVRAFNAFGPGQAVGPGHPQKIVPHFAVELLHGRPVPIWGDGKQAVDLIHVDMLASVLADAVDALGRFVVQAEPIVIDGGTGVPWAVLDVAHMVASALDMPLTAQFLPMRRGEKPTHIFAAGHGWEYLDVKPQWDEADLRDTVRWYAARYADADPWART